MAEGRVEPGFEGVRDEFEAVLSAADDEGAGFAAVVDGRPVVDLWGGLADNRTSTAWQEHTAAVVFSGSKGIVATLALLLAQRGILGFEARVADAWPEFEAGGKGDITVAQLLSHAGGLPAVERLLRAVDMARPRWISGLLARQRPMVPIGTPCYHAITYGWLASELFVRTDGRPAARLVEIELKRECGLDIAIGINARGLAPDTLAHLRTSRDFQLSAFLAGPPDPRLKLVYHNPPLQPNDWNDPELLALQVPAVNAVATARSLAAMYGQLVVRDDPLVAPEWVLRGRAEASAGHDPLSGRHLRFGPTGFELAGTPSTLGPPADAFGHTGSGGTSHGAWPGLRTGFSFVTARLLPETTDGRAGALLSALHKVVAG